MAAMAALSMASNTNLNGTTVIVQNNPMVQPMYPYPQAPYGQAYLQQQQQYGVQYGEPQPYYQPQPYQPQAQPLYNPSPAGYAK